MIAGEDQHAILRGEYAVQRQLVAQPRAGCALNGCHDFGAASGALVHHKPLGGVLAHAICARTFAVKQLLLALGGGRMGKRLEQRLAQRGGCFVDY